MIKPSKPLSLYVHVPFCLKKCAYCDFLSFPADNETRPRYVDALCDEIEQKCAAFREYEVKTVFIGGGTPTVLESEQIRRILRTINTNYSISACAEITIEANPKTVDYESLRRLRDCGINRLSLGLQANNNRLLSLIGRIHDCKAFDTNFDDARKAGFANINIDIMFALPSQTLNDWENTLDYAISKEPEHVSAYGLILEEGTPLFDLVSRNELSLPDEDAYLAMYRMAKEKLNGAGFERYEISNYARQSFECKHNLTYWRCMEYVGFGIGAASYTGAARYRNSDSFRKYLEQDFAPVERLEIQGNDAVSEFMFLGLRMSEGVSENSFVERFGADISAFYGQRVDSLMAAGLLARKRGRLFLTDAGIEVSNCVFADLLL